MKKKLLLFIVCFILLASVAASGICYGYSFTPYRGIIPEENKLEPENKNKGLYVQVNTDEVNRLGDLKADGIDNILAAFEIKKFLNKPLDADKLNELDSFLKKAKELGMKIIFRASYAFYGNYNDPESMDLIIGHIGQISSVLNNYKDTILCVQAGFLGPWGEWHGSGFLEKDAEKNRNLVIQTLLDQLDPSIIVNIRRPKFIRDAAGAGIPTDRLGIHNDGLLASSDDFGTYDNTGYSREQELDWMNKNLKVPVNGGEMPAVSEYTKAENAVKEFKAMQLSYLNREYNKEVLESWKGQTFLGQNAYDYIISHIGYLFSCTGAKLPVYIEDTGLTIKGSIENNGFSGISGNYQVFLAVKSQTQVYFYPIKGFDLSMVTAGRKQEFEVSVDLPKSIFSEEKLSIGISISDRGTSENEVFYFADYEIYNKQKKDLFYQDTSLRGMVKENLMRLFYRNPYYQLLK